MEIDARRLTDKESSHIYLKEALNLPDYYGKNLDALADCLSTMHGEITVTHIGEAGAYYRYVDKVLGDISEESRYLKIIKQ